MKKLMWSILLIGAYIAFGVLSNQTATVVLAQSAVTQMTGSPGQEVQSPVEVKLLDRRGRGISGVSVVFVVVQGGGSVWVGSSATNGQGVARDYWTLGPEPGLNVLEARGVDGDTGEKVIYGRFEADTRLTTTGTGTETGSGSCPIGTVLLNGECVSPACGDGFVMGEEECDDGNLVNGDGCSAMCTVEPLDCDDGNPCTDGLFDSISLGCQYISLTGNSCMVGQLQGICQAGVCQTSCGDGFVTGVEECDDGNLVNGDGCSATCTVEPTVCGDMVVAAEEECDDGNANNEDACLSTCQLATCGDAYVWAGVEECDDGNGNNSDACLSTCKAAICGDGFVRDGVEQCDDGNLVNGDGCSASCTIEVLPYGPMNGKRR